MPFIAHHMRKRKSRELDQTRLFDGVEAMLRELSDAGIALALVTSNSEPNARAILGAGNASLIRYYECGASLFGKAARFRRVLRRSGIAGARRDLHRRRNPRLRGGAARKASPSAPSPGATQRRRR